MLTGITAFFIGVAHARAASLPQAGQAAVQPQPGRLRVYLDCEECFDTYLRDEIEWVDFVRQPQDADVHLLSSSLETGGGGREIVLRFVGNNRFQGIDEELRALSRPAEPENLRRANILKTVEIGLLHYLARTGLPADLAVNVRTDDARTVDVQPVSDPWRLWFFRAGANGSADAEETTREFQWELNFSADRVTEAWKIAMGVEVSRQRERFDIDEDDPVEAIRKETNFDAFVAKSLGPHWSVGVESGITSSTFSNIKFQLEAAPALEFSVFPYREYATRQFAFQYQAGVQRSEYHEITLFDRLDETRPRHELSARFDQRQPWGSVETGIEWSQYLHDLGKYLLEIDGEVSVRLLRGLAVSFDGSASRIRDQISLPRRDATPEEVLLEIRELQSGFEVSFSAGITYSFGSIFNNVVNPRFGN
jgi:hypothetical protein